MLPRVPASACPLLALLSPYQHMHPSFNDFQCSADLGSRHDVASPTLQMPALALCPFQHPTLALFGRTTFGLLEQDCLHLPRARKPGIFSFSLLESPTTDGHLQELSYSGMPNLLALSQAAARALQSPLQVRLLGLVPETTLLLDSPVLSYVPTPFSVSPGSVSLTNHLHKNVHLGVCF